MVQKSCYPVEVGSLSQYLQGLIHPCKVVWDFSHQQYCMGCLLPVGTFLKNSKVHRRVQVVGWAHSQGPGELSPPNMTGWKMVDFPTCHVSFQEGRSRFCARTSQKQKGQRSFSYELQVASFPGDELFWSTILV